MKKYLVRLIVFFAAVVMVDMAFGYGMDRLYLQAKGGEIKETNDVCINNQYDIVVMGSSRAHHHYVPEIIEDSLGRTCFNIGKDGNGIVLMYGFYKMIVERYKPSLIIYDLSKYDIYEMAEDQNNTRYVSMLKPYSKHPGIDDIFKSLSWQEWIKTYSNLCRYNSVSFETVRQYLYPSSYNEDGYWKLDGFMNDESQIVDIGAGKIDTLKTSFFRRFVVSTKENSIPLVCVISPSYHAVSSSLFNPIKEICAENGILLLDYYTSDAFFRCKEFFKDQSHMNDRGARFFTNEIVKVLDTIK